MPLPIHQLQARTRRQKIESRKIGMGEIDPEECTDTLNKLILDFYNCYLKGQGGFGVQEHY